MNPTEPQVHREQSTFMNEQSVRGIDFEAADERIKQLSRDAHTRALRLGVRDAHKQLDTPALQESIAKQALLEQYIHQQKESRQPGPARRKAPKVSARKRAKASRKKNR